MLYYTLGTKTHPARIERPCSTASPRQPQAPGSACCTTYLTIQSEKQATSPVPTKPGSAARRVALPPRCRRLARVHTHVAPGGQGLLPARARAGRLTRRDKLLLRLQSQRSAADAALLVCTAVCASLWLFIGPLLTTCSVSPPFFHVSKRHSVSRPSLVSLQEPAIH